MLRNPPHYVNITEATRKAHAQMEIKEFDTRLIGMRDKMFRIARNMLSDGPEAEDAVQDTLEKMLVRRGDMDEYHNLEAYVFTVLRNNYLDRLRRNSRYPSSNIDDCRPIAVTTDARKAEMADMKAIIAAAIASLPEKQRTAVHLRDVEGCTMEEIAGIMSIDETSVRMNLSRGCKTLREKLQKIMDHGTDNENR